jgi:hypothetical protein
MDYQIIQLSDELIYIRWQRTPKFNSGADAQFLADLQKLLDEATTPQYFISDLRRGRIADMRSIRQLGQLTQHKNWAGSSAFSQDPITSLLVQSFRTFAPGQLATNDEIQAAPADALKFLEQLKPGVTDGIDWNAVINEDSAGG